MAAQASDFRPVNLTRTENTKRGNTEKPGAQATATVYRVLLDIFSLYKLVDIFSDREKKYYFINIYQVKPASCILVS